MVDNTGTALGRRMRRQDGLLLLLLLLGLCDDCLVTGGMGGSGISSAQQLREGTHKLCGSMLTNAMDLVCVGGYNSMPFSKRVPGVELPGQRRRQARYALSPLLSSLKTRRLRRQRYVGVYDECCVNSCSYDELLAYCREQ